MAQEIDCPEGIEPLEWMLLTTMAVENFDEAVEKLGWYAKRWGIEVYHRTLKAVARLKSASWVALIALRRAWPSTW